MRHHTQQTVLKMISILLVVLALTCAVSVAADGNAELLGGERLVVRFKSGKAALSPDSRSQIRQLLEKYNLGPEDKILVVGYTDDRGKKDKNSKLADMRAQAVKKELVRHKGIDAGNIIAIGRGARNPVGDNRLKEGRARNRRVEIYLSQVATGRKKYERSNPDKAAIEQLVKEAREMLRHQKVESALQLLKKAHAMGGDQFSDWYAVTGIAGYYARMPLAEVMAHLVKALQMDPLHAEAREYFGRVDARQKFAAGQVTPQMGRRPDDPIMLSSVTQPYEYLRLFNVQPISRAFVDPESIEMWQCRDAAGRLMNYYFNHSKVHDWLFTQEETNNG